jgi:predicted RND superfamily exporter protein
MGREYYGFGDLRPDSPIKAEIDYADRTFGGTNTLAIFIEPGTRKLAEKPTGPLWSVLGALDLDKASEVDFVLGVLGLKPIGGGPPVAPLGAWPAEEPLLDPRAFRLEDRVATLLETTFPKEVKRARSAADYVKKAHRILAPEEAAKDPIPATRNLAAQEVQFVDDGKILRDYLDFERGTASIFVNVPDVGSTRQQQMMDEMRPKFDAIEREMAAAGYPVQITITGMFAIGYDVFLTLVDGLLASLGISMLVSFLVFFIVLRSWKLGLIALVPNVVPLALTFGFMGISGIQLTPTTVIVYSITLVIADDDTTQYFARFKVIFAEALARGDPDPHRSASLATLRESGLPMFITACAVSLGFLTLMGSRFLGLAHFGLLVGVSLFTAIFGDLFLTPIMLMKWKPRVFKELAAKELVRKHAEAAAAAEVTPAAAETTPGREPRP